MSTWTCVQTVSWCEHTRTDTQLTVNLHHEHTIIKTGFIVTHHTRPQTPGTCLNVSRLCKACWPDVRSITFVYANFTHRTCSGALVMRCYSAALCLTYPIHNPFSSTSSDVRVTGRNCVAQMAVVITLDLAIFIFDE
jgi:hypothetical protein